eukprot:scaffold27636_cov107-Isochrysis_galbana.AAC.1
MRCALYCADGAAGRVRPATKKKIFSRNARHASGGSTGHLKSIAYRPSVAEGWCQSCVHSAARYDTQYMHTAATYSYRLTAALSRYRVPPAYTHTDSDTTLRLIDLGRLPT